MADYVLKTNFMWDAKFGDNLVSNGAQKLIFKHLFKTFEIDLGKYVYIWEILLSLSFH